MPTRPATRCPNCKRLHAGTGQCAECARLADQQRGSARARGYDHHHRTEFRAEVLARDPVCVLCRARPSTVADHHPRSRRELVAQGLDPNDPRYGRGLCGPCHSRATQATEGQRGGWNRR